MYPGVSIVLCYLLKSVAISCGTYCGNQDQTCLVKTAGHRLFLFFGGRKVGGDYYVWSSGII